ncbi:MAG: 3-deoxy-D-manno-octulosonate cytidylyltransferase [Bacteroidetes bacterium 43-16]|nr:MAG: 3-deoxy-D-manno-octulosonate cytidylyltransferase [Bacteroidetes bacterium 43-16]
MKVCALIPARIGSTRLANKLLIDLEGKPVIRRTYEAALQTGLFDQVIVVTDSDEIESVIRSCGGEVIRSTRAYESGTDRIAAAAQDIEADIFINVQGDEPFVQHQPLAQLIALFQDAEVQVGSIRKPIYEKTLTDSPHIVKVVCDRYENALLFSRSPIPYARNPEASLTYYQHIGVYGFRKTALLLFPTLAQTTLEKVEQLEQLRFLENGIAIKMTTVSEMGIGIDVADDIERAIAYLKQQSGAGEL